jgi:gas vesicle protein
LQGNPQVKIIIMKKNIFLVLLAALAGALAGILLAPDKGSETRKKLKKKARDAADRLKEKIDEAAAAGKEKFQ